MLCYYGRCDAAEGRERVDESYAADVFLWESLDAGGRGEWGVKGDGSEMVLCRHGKAPGCYPKVMVQPLVPGSRHSRIRVCIR